MAWTTILLFDSAMNMRYPWSYCSNNVINMHNTVNHFWVRVSREYPLCWKNLWSILHGRFLRIFKARHCIINAYKITYLEERMKTRWIIKKMREETYTGQSWIMSWLCPRGGVMLSGPCALSSNFVPACFRPCRVW